MFTGLIQNLGNLYTLSQDKLRISCVGENSDRILQDLELGDSVAVDGVCLTVENILNQGFIASASPETLRRSTLGQLKQGAVVNLEVSLRVGGKIGGHFVTGHVDGLGCFQESVQIANSWEMRFTVPDRNVSRYIVPKGSIGINGVSLTVADCNLTGDWFKVAVIPVTYAETNLSQLKPGQWINLEGDVLGKYVEKFLRLGPHSLNGPVSELEEMLTEGKRDITPGFLTEHGYG